MNVKEKPSAWEGKNFPDLEILFKYDTKSFLKHYSAVFSMPANKASGNMWRLYLRKKRKHYFAPSRYESEKNKREILRKMQMPFIS